MSMLMLSKLTILTMLLLIMKVTVITFVPMLHGV